MDLGISGSAIWMAVQTRVVERPANLPISYDPTVQFHTVVLNHNPVQRSTLYSRTLQQAIKITNTRESGTSHWHFMKLKPLSSSTDKILGGVSDGWGWAINRIGEPRQWGNFYLSQCRLDTMYLRPVFLKKTINFPNLCHNLQDTSQWCAGIFILIGVSTNKTQETR